MRVGIIGCGGRMGQLLITEILETVACQLVGGVDHPNSPYIGQDLSSIIGRLPIGLTVGANLRPLFDVADVLIDFSSPEVTAVTAALAAESGKALVVGTTGLEAEQTAALATSARRVAILHSPNMSLGMNVLFAVVESVSHILNNNYDVEILEIHHRNKVDVPSGTALSLGRVIAQGRSQDSIVLSRNSGINQRQHGDIGFAAIRGGDIVGEHTVFFATEGERLELTHKASSRAIFARGAVQAALWIYGRKPGLYSMRDVLGI